jgi:chitinase
MKHYSSKLKRICILAEFSILTLIFMLGTIVPLSAQKKIVGYAYTTTSASKIDFTRITHLNLAFENPDDAGNLSFGSGSNALIIAAHANNVKVLVSICGGAASNNATIRNRYFNLIKPANRAAFISKIVSYLDAHNFDGIDVDLEGAAINSDYSAFVIALKNALPNKLVTSALSHTNGGNNVSSTAAQKFDFINIMAYDHGWGQAGHHSTYDFAVTSMEWWVQNKGLQPGKAILGVPFYGYNNVVGTGYRSYANIINTYGTAAANQDTWTSGGNIVYYNGVPTIRKKSQLVMDKNYGGIMIWELTQDLPSSNSLSLLNNIRQVIGNTSCQPIAIKPYLSVNNGNWQPVSAVTLAAGDNVVIGPQPLDGTWKWAGPNGFTATTRQITISNIQSSQGGNYVATYTNPCGAQSTLTFSITVAGGSFSVTIEAENYLYMSGIATEPCSEGGLNVGWFNAGDWVSYGVNIPASGTYTITYRVASIYSGKALRLEKDAGTTVLGVVNIPNTGSWQTWTSVSHNVTLPAGSYSIAIATSTDGWNINWFTISSSSNSSAKEGARETENNIAIKHGNHHSFESAMHLIEEFNDGHLKVIDLSGKEYISINGKINNSSNDIALLPPGFYILRIAKGQRSMITKFYKK